MIVFFGHSKLGLIILLFIIGLKSLHRFDIFSHFFYMGFDWILINLLFDISLNLDLSDLAFGKANCFFICFSFNYRDFLFWFRFGNPIKTFYIFLNWVKYVLFSIYSILTLSFGLLLNLNNQLILWFRE